VWCGVVFRSEGLEHRITIDKESDELPSSQTCFNKMKIPSYPSKEVLAQKLLYAIENCVTYQNA